MSSQVEFRADLHCHTLFSDGTMTPKELIQHAKEMGLSGLSITDHDSIGAYPEALDIARDEGILLGTGVEFSSVHHGMSVHVLGYDFDLECSDLLALCRRHLDRRRERNQKILEKLAAYGMSIELEEKGLPLGRPHIALALVEKGYAKSVQDAFIRWIGDRKPCFHPGAPITTQETLLAIHQAGGKAFLAHPHIMRNPKRVQALLDAIPFDGIEGYYSKCSSDQEGRWIGYAKKKGLLISGGSDFHGAVKPGIPLGCSWVNKETFDQIFQRYR
jgi:3',5'-nucleoside bisphosphate phosphatase